MCQRLRRQIVSQSRRNIYFTRPENMFVVRSRDGAEIDFPLNIGYNNYFENYCNQYLGSTGKLRRAFRRRQLNPLFLLHYHDLLRAICNHRYEKLEMLCEE